MSGVGMVLLQLQMVLSVKLAMSSTVLRLNASMLQHQHHYGVLRPCPALRAKSRHSITSFIRELDEIDIGSPRTPNEIAPAHLGKVELSEWATNEVSEQNRELLCRRSLHGIRCHPEQ